jgi:N5-(cytidine 5'-diphosphoramidyl)-L-glutamine hydrolase
MSLVAVTQRVDVIPERNERRDALDQRWTALLSACELLPVLVPNSPGQVEQIIMELPIRGVVLTGGNDLVACGGKTPERDETELKLLRLAIEHKIPVLGICRGMQLIQHHFGVQLGPVDGHVKDVQEVMVGGTCRTVNSYHRYGTTRTVTDLEVCAVAQDGVVKAVRHRVHSIYGFMWHPERLVPFPDEDVRMIRQLFLGTEKVV